MWSFWNDYDRWSDVSRAFAELDTFRRQFDRLFTEQGYRTRMGDALAGDAPRANLHDTGSEYLVSVDVPGLSNEDVKLTLHDGVLTVAGERKVQPLEGYAVHRRERGAYRFRWSFRFPAKVDPERVTASLKNGVLTATVAKVPEAQPRQITVTAS